jgi:hypothetical protein
MVKEKKTVKESVSQTNIEVGYDPTHYNRLAFFPLDAGDQRIPSKEDR